MVDRLTKWLLLVLLASGLCACSTAHTARPLGKGNHAVHVSVGGPVAAVGNQTRVLIPLTTLTYKYGLTERADIFVGWHVLETFVNDGNAFFDIGTSYYFLDQRGGRPGLSGAVTVSPLVNKKSGWASIDLQLTASWFLDPGERHLLYLGFHNFLTPVRSQLVPTPTYTFSPYFGGQLRLGRHREVMLGVEMKWHRPYADTSKMVLNWLGLANRGAFAFVGGVTIAFGKRAKSNTADGGEHTVETDVPASTEAAPSGHEEAPATNETPPPDGTMTEPTEPDAPPGQDEATPAEDEAAPAEDEAAPAEGGIGAEETRL